MKPSHSQSKQLLKELARGLAIVIGMVILCAAISFGLSSCKAWRTISTTATYVQQNDTAKSTATITTKTTEEYVGIRKK